MSKKELKQQVKDLCTVLNYHIDYSEGADKYIDFILDFAKVSDVTKRKLESMEGIREIKKRKLTNEYVKRFNAFDIHEALDISIKEARKKVKKFDFTTKEKNIILRNFQGGAKTFLNKYGEVSN